MRLLFNLIFLCLYIQVLAQPAVDQLRVLKAERKLQVLSQGKVLREFSIVLGGEPKGRKTREGDGKTPEGLYSIDYRNERSGFYKALHISYPSVADIARAKALGVSPGGQIMIHGQKNRLGWLAFVSQHFDWTSGCIALNNSDMDVLWSLTPAGTPIEILP